MRIFIILIIALILPLSANAVDEGAKIAQETKAVIAEIEKLNYCEKAEDCSLVSLPCPDCCSGYVNKNALEKFEILKKKQNKLVSKELEKHPVSFHYRVSECGKLAPFYKNPECIQNQCLQNTRGELEQIISEASKFAKVGDKEALAKITYPYPETHEYFSPEDTKKLVEDGLGRFLYTPETDFTNFTPLTSLQGDFIHKCNIISSSLSPDGYDANYSRKYYATICPKNGEVEKSLYFFVFERISKDDNLKLSYESFVTSVEGKSEEKIISYANEMIYKYMISPSLNSDPLSFLRSKKDPPEILQLETSTSYPSSANNTEMCKSWSLSKEQVLKFFQDAEQITGEDWHHFFDVLPCHVTGKLKWHNEICEFDINSGSWGDVNCGGGYKTLGYYTKDDKNMFLSEAWEVENDN